MGSKILPSNMFGILPNLSDNIPPNKYRGVATKLRSVFSDPHCVLVKPITPTPYTTKNGITILIPKLEIKDTIRKAYKKNRASCNGEQN